MSDPGAPDPRDAGFGAGFAGPSGEFAAGAGFANAGATGFGVGVGGGSGCGGATEASLGGGGRVGGFAAGATAPASGSAACRALSEIDRLGCASSAAIGASSVTNCTGMAPEISAGALLQVISTSSVERCTASEPRRLLVDARWRGTEGASSSSP